VAPKLQLTQELIRLIHHVELNKVGWWEKTIQRLILAAMWLSGGNATSQGILEILQKDFQVNLDAAKIDAQINKLCRSGTLAPLSDGRIKISEQAKKDLENAIKEAEGVEQKAKDSFLTALKHYCPSLQPEPIWEQFNDLLLHPLLKQIGAKTLEILSRDTLDFAATSELNTFLNRFPIELRDPLRAAIISFLDPKNPDVRAYILRALNVYFSIEASGLSEDVLKLLTESGASPPSLTIFVDTNFIFSILGLHENPSNEAAQSLTQLIKQTVPSISVKLYALPITIDEARNVLITTEQELNGLRLTPNLSNAALETCLTGIVQKFFEESKKVSIALNPEIYFAPYKRNLIKILKDKGVELFNQELENYKTKQAVIDDILEQKEFEEQWHGKKAKQYKTLEHDMVLWHFVHDNRSPRVESPLEARYWIVTVDYRFLGFDAFKRRQNEENMPICIHPMTLIQMLQFWIPRTHQLEEALLSSLRLPFLFQEFDQEAEKVTIQILKTMSRFENIGDLPTDTVKAVLLNEALRQRLSATQDVEEQINLVREALIEEITRIREEHIKTQLELESKSKEAENLKGMVKQTEEANRQIEEKVYLLEKELEQTLKEKKELEKKLNQLEVKLQSKIAAEAERQEIWKFVIKWSGYSVLIGSLGVVFFKLFQLLNIINFWGLVLLVTVATMFFWVWLTDRIASNNPLIKEKIFFIYLRKFKKWLFGLFGTLALGVLINAIYEWLKGLCH